MIVFIVPAPLAFASAETTMKKTSTGARPFNALVNRLPSKAMNCVRPMRKVLKAPPLAKLSDSSSASGSTIPSMAPMTRPTTMRKIRLTPLYFSHIRFI